MKWINFFLFTQLNNLCIFHTIETKVWLFSAVKNSRISLIPLRSFSLGLDLKSKSWISAYPSRVNLNNSFLNLEASDRIPEILLSSSFKCKLLLLSSWLKGFPQSVFSNRKISQDKQEKSPKQFHITVT